MTIALNKAYLQSAQKSSKRKANKNSKHKDNKKNRMIESSHFISMHDHLMLNINSVLHVFLCNGFQFSECTFERVNDNLIIKNSKDKAGRITIQDYFITIAPIYFYQQQIGTNFLIRMSLRDHLSNTSNNEKSSQQLSMSFTTEAFKKMSISLIAEKHKHLFISDQELINFVRYWYKQGLFQKPLPPEIITQQKIYTYYLNEMIRIMQDTDIDLARLLAISNKDKFFSMIPIAVKFGTWIPKQLHVHMGYEQILKLIHDNTFASATDESSDENIDTTENIENIKCNYYQATTTGKNVYFINVASQLTLDADKSPHIVLTHGSNFTQFTFKKNRDDLVICYKNKNASKETVIVRDYFISTNSVYLFQQVLGIDDKLIGIDLRTQLPPSFEEFYLQPLTKMKPASNFHELSMQELAMSPSDLANIFVNREKLLNFIKYCYQQKVFKQESSQKSRKERAAFCKQKIKDLISTDPKAAHLLKDFSGIKKENIIKRIVGLRKKFSEEVPLDQLDSYIVSCLKNARFITKPASDVPKNRLPEQNLSALSDSLPEQMANFIDNNSAMPSVTSTPFLLGSTPPLTGKMTSIP